MNKYKIPCTEEQTRKAFVLGAPIEKTSIKGFDYVKELPYDVYHLTKLDDFYYMVPTTEEMIGWLEEQDGIKSIAVDKTDSWQYVIWDSNGYVIWCDTNFNSRKEATLAAIDMALEFLSKNEK